MWNSGENTYLGSILIGLKHLQTLAPRNEHDERVMAALKQMDEILWGLIFVLDKDVEDE